MTKTNRKIDRLIYNEGESRTELDIPNLKKLAEEEFLRSQVDREKIKRQIEKEKKLAFIQKRMGELIEEIDKEQRAWLEEAISSLNNLIDRKEGIFY